MGIVGQPYKSYVLSRKHKSTILFTYIRMGFWGIAAAQEFVGPYGVIGFVGSYGVIEFVGP